MSTVVFDAYWPECRMKFCFSLMSPDKWNSGGREKSPTWPTHAQGTFTPHRHLYETHPTELRTPCSHSPHCMARAHLQPQWGARDPAPLDPLPNPYLAWDRAGRISRKGNKKEGTASTVCCMSGTTLAMLGPELSSKWTLCPDSDKGSRDSRKGMGKEDEPPQGGRVDRTRMGV